MREWTTLEHTCRNCQKCALSDTRRQVVFGQGCPTGSVLVVGDTPEPEDSVTGIPFSGKEGSLLRDFFSFVDLSPQTHLYFTHIQKCYSQNPVIFTQMESCLAYLRQQVLLLRPRVIVCLGGIVATRLIAPSFRLEENHGVFFEKNGVLMMGCYHPRTLLTSPKHKADMFDDMEHLKKKLLELGTL